MIIAPKLQYGDQVRVIAPSMSMSYVSADTARIAEETLSAWGLKITYSKNVYEKDDFYSSSIQSRIDDLHAAFEDKNVKLILCALGGFNSHQLLSYIDYSLIKKNPKRICGFSDSTAITNAIYHKTGLVTYSGPCFVNFGMAKGREYIDRYFHQLMFSDEQLNIKSSENWSDDKWFKNQVERNFYTSSEYHIINAGNASGTIVGGNIATLKLLFGTQYMPSLENKIIFIEDDQATSEDSVDDAIEFDRSLQALAHQPNFSKAQGMVIGRFKKKSGVKGDSLKKIILGKPEFKNIPVLSNVDFGHTTPFFTFPVGGNAILDLTSENVVLQISE